MDRSKDFHFHELRHTFASWLVIAGVDIHTVQELMGHNCYDLTLLPPIAGPQTQGNGGARKQVFGKKSQQFSQHPHLAPLSEIKKAV
jgi:hypothetical protein